VEHERVKEGPLVLVVDDDPLVTDMLKRALAGAAS